MFKQAKVEKISKMLGLAANEVLEQLDPVDLEKIRKIDSIIAVRAAYIAATCGSRANYPLMKKWLSLCININEAADACHCASYGSKEAILAGKKWLSFCKSIGQLKHVYNNTNNAVQPFALKQLLSRCANYHEAKDVYFFLQKTDDDYQAMENWLKFCRTAASARVAHKSVPANKFSTESLVIKKQLMFCQSIGEAKALYNSVPHNSHNTFYIEAERLIIRRMYELI
ncbi:MAG: hypothetical protein V1928_00765 [Parcubacteria group bacterium]